jgi:hypothetical protein
MSDSSLYFLGKCLLFCYSLKRKKADDLVVAETGLNVALPRE